MAKAPQGTIDYAALEAMITGQTQTPGGTTPAPNLPFKELLAELVQQNKEFLNELKKTEGFVRGLSNEVKKNNSAERKERNPNKKNKEFNKTINQNKLFKVLEKFLNNEVKSSKMGTASASTKSTSIEVDSSGYQKQFDMLSRELQKKGILSPETLNNFKTSLGGINQLLVGSDSLSYGIKQNFSYVAQEILNIEDYYGGFLKQITKGIGAQANFTREMRATLYETAGATKESQNLFRTLEQMENTTKITGVSQQKLQENLVKYAKAGVKYEGNAVKYRDKLVNLATIQLATEKQLGLEAGDLFDNFNNLYQAGRLTEGEIADIGRGMRDIARQTGLTGKNLTQALTASQSIIEAMKKASTLTSSSVKNVTQTLAQAEKLGVTDQTKTLLEAASSSANLFYNASDQTRALLYSAAGTVGKIGDLQNGVLTRSRQGIKSLSEGVENILKRFGVESMDAIDNLSDSAKRNLNLNLKASFGMELGEFRNVVESLKEGGKGFAERVADIDKKLKTNLTNEEKLGALEEKRRLQTSQSLEALTALDKAAVGAKNMEDALLKFGDRRKEFEKDLQALGLKGTNKEVIKGALEQAIRGIEASSKKSLGITSNEIQKALEDPVSFRELSSKITKAEAAAATKQKTQLDATEETNQVLREIQAEVQTFSGSFISMFMSNAGPLGVIASSLALVSGPTLIKGIAGGLKNVLGFGKGAPLAEAADTTRKPRKRKVATAAADLTTPTVPKVKPTGIKSMTGGFTAYAMDFAAGAAVLLAAAAIIYGGIKLLEMFGLDFDEKKIIATTKKIGTLFAATLFLSTEVLAFSAILKTMSKMNKTFTKGLLTGFGKSAATFVLMAGAVSLLGYGLNYLSTIVDQLGIDENKLIQTTKKLSTLFLSVAALSLVVIAATLPMTLVGAAVIATGGTIIPALVIGAAIIPILAGILFSYAVKIEELSSVLNAMDLPSFYKTADTLSTVFMAVAKVSSAIAVAGTAALAGLAGGLLGGVAVALDKILSIVQFDTATSIGRVIEWVGGVAKAANDSINKIGISPEQLIDSAEKLNAIVGPGAKLLGNIALIGAAMIGLSVTGTVGTIAGGVAKGIGWAAGKIGELFGGSGKNIGDPKNVIEDVVNGFYELLSIVPAIVDSAEAKYRLTGESLKASSEKLNKLAEAPKGLAKTFISISQQLIEIVPSVKSLSDAASAVTGSTTDPEKLQENLIKVFSILGGISQASPQILDSIGNLLSSSGTAAVKLYENTKNIPFKKVQEALDLSKSMTNLFADFINTSKELGEKLNSKNLEEVKKQLSDDKLPKTLESIFKNIQITLGVFKNYRISNIEIKASAEKMSMIGTFIKGVGTAASGLKEANAAFQTIKETKALGKQGSSQAIASELKTFFNTLITSTKDLLDVMKQSGKDLNVIEIGKFTNFGNVLGKFLDSFKGVLVNFKINVLDEINKFSSDDIGKMLKGDIERTDYYKNWWGSEWEKTKKYHKNMSDITFSFKAIFQTIVDIDEQVRTILKDAKAKSGTGTSLESELQQNFKTLSNISDNFKYFATFLNTFQKQILPTIMFAIEKKELFQFKKYGGSEESFNLITDSFWKILLTIWTLQSNIKDIIERMEKETPTEDFTQKISKLESRTKPIINNFETFKKFMNLFDDETIKKITNFKVPPEETFTKFKDQIVSSFSNLNKSILDKDFLDKIQDFSNNIPQFPTMNLTKFMVFGNALSEMIKDFSKTFSFLNEMPEKPIVWTTNANINIVDNVQKEMPTMAEKISKIKDFFSKDFKPILKEFSSITSMLSSETLNPKDFEKAGSIMSGFGNIAGSLSDLITSLGTIGYEFSSTEITTTSGQITKTVTTLEYVKDIITNPATNELSKIMRVIPEFILNNLIIPFKSTRIKITPEQMTSISKILESTVVSINALSGPNGLFANLGQLDPENIKKGTKELEKLKNVKINDIYGSKDTSYLIADFIIGLIQNVIAPLSILNKVTSVKRIENIGKIIAGVKDVAVNLPQLIEAVGTNSKKLLEVDPTTNLNKVEEVNAKLEEVGEYLPEFVISVFNNVVVPLARLPVSGKLIGSIGAKIKGITDIANNLPTLIENLSSKFPKMLEGMESIDTTLASQLEEKGKSFKDVFVSLLGFITNGIVVPLLMSAANPKYLMKASSQILSLADLSSSLGPVLIGFFKSMEEMLDYANEKYGDNSGQVFNQLSEIFDNGFFRGEFNKTLDQTINNLHKFIEVERLVNDLTSFDTSAFSNIFKDFNMDTVNLDTMESAMINFGNQLDKIISIMNNNLNKINEINSLGEISVKSGEISTAANAEIPANKKIDMYSQNVQMKESATSTDDSYDELVELNDINKSMEKKQDSVINLLAGILKSLNIPIPSGASEEFAGNPQKSFNLQESTGAFSAKLQTGTTSRAAYVKGNNMMVTSSGPFVSG
jgi:hypothetical protein